MMLNFLFRRRWFYFVIAIALGGLYYSLRNDFLISPTRQYITTYRIKYSNDKKGQITKEEKQLHWQMVNPYDYQIAKKYFESTKLIDEAGQIVNYTVVYYADGKDIYAVRPVEVRFLDERISNIDEWKMTITLGEEELEVSSLTGTFHGDKLTNDSFKLKYDEVCDSPLGKVLVKRLHADSKIKKLKLKKISELEAQEKYDSRMDRFTDSGNLIEMFLTADCSPEFAHDFFEAIAKSYNHYAQDSYQRELKLYLARLSKAKEELKTGNFACLDSLMLKTERDPEAIKKMIANVELLEEEALTNALVLSQEDMLEIIDNTYIRKPKQSLNPRVLIKYLAILFILVIPFLLAVLECFLRDWVLSRFTLPEDWLIGDKTLRLPKTMSLKDGDMLRLYLNKKIGESPQRFLLSSNDDVKTKMRIVEPLSKSMTQVGKSLECITINSLKEFDNLRLEEHKADCIAFLLPSSLEHSLALELQQRLGAELFLLLAPLEYNHKEIELFAEQCTKLGIKPNILWQE